MMILIAWLSMKYQWQWVFPKKYQVVDNIIIIIIKLYLDTVNSGTAVPFTGVHTH